MSGEITIRVKPNSKKNEILEKSRGIYTVAVKAEAKNNKANTELIRFLSKRFKKNIEIVKGIRSRKKVIRFT
jgi:hypothetical protein